MAALPPAASDEEVITMEICGEFFMVEGVVGLVAAAKGFIDSLRHALLAERNGIVVITPPRKGMTSPYSWPARKACGRLRKHVAVMSTTLS